MMIRMKFSISKLKIFKTNDTKFKKKQGKKKKKEGKAPRLSLLTDKQTAANLKFVQASKKLGETSHSVDWPKGGQMSGAGAAPTSVRLNGPIHSTNGTTAGRTRSTHFPGVATTGLPPLLSKVGEGSRANHVVAPEGEMLISASGVAISRPDKI